MESTQVQTIKSAVIQRKGEKAITVTFDDVKKRICETATEAEIILFLNRCQSEQLDPFRNEIYLVKYGTDKAQTIIAIESYLKIAESRDNYERHEAGIILKKKDQAPEFREGEILFDDEKSDLAGGWARVYLSDRPNHPVYVSVNIREYQKYTKDGGHLTHFWQVAPAAQIRKVALAHALKEAFPSRFAGTVVEGEYEETSDEDTVPEAFKVGEEENWKLFWSKQKEKGLNYKSCLTILGINKMHEDWLDKGKTLEQADQALTDYLGKGKPETTKTEPSATTPAPEPTKPVESTESEMMFNNLESASTPPQTKVDADWVKTTIFNLRKNGCTEVTGSKLTDRWKNKYNVKEGLEGLTIKQSILMLLPADAEDFCKWLQELEEKYPTQAKK